MLNARLFQIADILADGVRPLSIYEGTASITLTATLNDTATGGSNITGAEYFDTIDPGNGNGVSMSAADGTFDSPVEDVTIGIKGNVR